MSQTSNKQGSFNKLTQFNSQLLMGSKQDWINLSNTDNTQQWTTTNSTLMLPQDVSVCLMYRITLFKGAGVA